MGLDVASGRERNVLTRLAQGECIGSELRAVLPVWSRLLQRRWALGVVAGINAAVVGLLAAALYDPVWTQGVRGPVDFAVAVIGFALLAGARVSALWVVLWCVLARWLAAMAGL